MATDTDFVVLYQELVLDSGCSLDAFRQAYRKRVGLLHPDRQGAPDNAAKDLQRLNAMYAAAMEFHRRHGRLPGASQAATTSVLPPIQPAAMARREQPPRASRWMLMLLAIVLVGFLVQSMPDSGESVSPPTPGSASLTKPTASTTAVPTPRVISLGSTAQQVRELNGEPVSGWEQRWEYGPSFVEFRCGLVVDWYSSPLRPLRTDTEHPPASTDKLPPKNCKE